MQCRFFNTKQQVYFLFAIISFSFCLSIRANEKYWVFFTDKKGVKFDAYSYFDAEAIQRRIDNNIPVSDSTDFPVSEGYVNVVKNIADSVSYSSRWLNAIAVFSNKEAVAQIRELPFVASVSEMMVCGSTLCKAKEFNAGLIISENELIEKQTGRMGGEVFKAKGIDGKGIRIAVLDAGFPTVDVNLVFEHIRNRNGIISTYDFVRKNNSVYDYNSHGTMVLSCIAGIINGKNLGLATGAEFLLARTENAFREPFSEEENWLAAVEWADKNGANIISSSLGYTYHRYFTNQMDGKTSLIARAAGIAARKGILVVNAAGNEGDDDWKIVATPGDADSVLTVGGIDPETDYHIDFSSYGPSKNKTMKPNVCAYGMAVVASKKKLQKMSGTSFSAPLIAGFAACAWQSHRSVTSMTLFKEIEHSGHLYPYFDYAHGFGVPQANYFIDTSKINIAPTFDMQIQEGVLKVIVKDEFSKAAKSGNAGLLYYHIQNATGKIEKYFVVSVSAKEVLGLIIRDLPLGSTVGVHYKGYTVFEKIN